MNRSVVETLMGAVVLFVAASFVWISYSSGHIAKEGDGYRITAKFTEVGTLNVGSDVRIGGIKVGTVTEQSLDYERYMAVVTLSLQNQVQVPSDSTVAIVSDGLLGGKYVSITPGADDIMLADGEEAEFTQDAISLESLIAKFAFGSVEENASE